MDLILSKPLVKVINRVDTSRHRVIISNTLICPFPFMIAKINVFFITKITHCGDQLHMTVDNFVFVDAKQHIDINQCTHDLAAPTLGVIIH